MAAESRVVHVTTFAKYRALGSTNLKEIGGDSEQFARGLCDWQRCQPGPALFSGVKVFLFFFFKQAVL